jgi:hypothetical protein
MALRKLRSLCANVLRFDYSLTLRTLFLKTSSRSDYDRWSNDQNLQASWDSRTELMARLVPPNTRVLELGAGRQILRHHLHPSCAYFALDLVARTPETIVCDLNSKPLPDLRPGHFDVAVLSGVLEYIHDVSSFVAWLTDQVRICITSYCCHYPHESATGDFIRRNLRLRGGWVNSLTEADLVLLFTNAGFRCTRKESWIEAQTIFVFERG